MKYNKLYSINLVAFLYLMTGELPLLEGDAATKQTYFLVEDTQKNSLLIQIYRNNRVSVDLKGYLAAYRHIRQLMREYGKKE